ncbi:hypothetical protein IJI86_03330 [Candidatus Saccharibacteria bacterium]|nr:hypothetical protein [Candidatus Saccharibacteria bacterium]
MTEKNKNKNSKKTKEDPPLLAALDAMAERDVKSPGVKNVPNEMMEIVAHAVPVRKKLKKVFTDEEIAKFLDEKISQEARAKFKDEVKRIKRRVLDLEATNRTQLIFYKSSENGDFYKALDTSALYYAHRLAQLMGRKCNVMIDKDRFLKADFVASISGGIDKFTKQYKELEGLEPEVTLDGIYIFPLKEPITDEEYQMLRQTEKTRQERVHNILKPKNMSPAVYQQILMIIRQLAPKSEKLKDESINYRIFGTEMLMNLRNIMAIYSDYSNGAYDTSEAGRMILAETGRIKATLVILGETRKWGAVPLASAGNNIEILEKVINKDLC